MTATTTTTAGRAGWTSHLPIALVTGLLFAWPLGYLWWAYGSAYLPHTLAGDAYHYLDIARWSVEHGRYTYDGVHVTNGFHPLWQYYLRGLFTLLGTRSHLTQVEVVVASSWLAATVGVVFAALAIGRMTHSRWLPLVLVPGLHYLVVGVHVRNLHVWTAIDGMESAFSVLFGGVFFWVASHWACLSPAAMNPATPETNASQPSLNLDPVAWSRALGWVLPWLVLSRLDDVFLVFGLALALVACPVPWAVRIKAALWLVMPSVVLVLAYMVYNRITAGSAMPLSGGTKAGFAGHVSAYLTAVIHFPPLLGLKEWLTGKPSDGATVFSASFRFVQMVYPLAMAAIVLLALRPWQVRSALHWLAQGLMLYVAIKLGYNFLFVGAWHQAGWYYAFMTLGASVMGALVLKQIRWPAWELSAVRRGVLAMYVALALLSGSQYFASLAFPPSTTVEARMWRRADTMRADLVQRGVTGIINVDDGISAFLLDLPAMHGFAFATDVQAQKAFREGRMLSLAQSRGINAIIGVGYLMSAKPLDTPEALDQYLRSGHAWTFMQAEYDKFVFETVYWDADLALPVIRFKPKRL